MAPPAALNSAEPTSPSQDFFGLTFGAIGCLPNSTPAAYPPMSLRTVSSTKTMTRSAPSSARSEQRGERGQERHVHRREDAGGHVAHVARGVLRQPPQQHGEERQR